jgi:hypothetical protein
LWICNKKNPIAIDDASNFGEDHNFGEDRSTKLGFHPTNPNMGYTVLESWSLCFFEIPDSSSISRSGKLLVSGFRPLRNRLWTNSFFPDLSNLGFRVRFRV